MFSVRYDLHSYIISQSNSVINFKENPGTGNVRGLNLAADKPTTVQVSNCRFLVLNNLKHKLLHYPALTDVPVYSRT
jgi:hypothetical protein